MSRDSGVVSPLSWSVYSEEVASCLLAGAKNLRVTRREGIVQQAREHFAYPPVIGLFPFQFLSSGGASSSK